MEYEDGGLDPGSSFLEGMRKAYFFWGWDEEDGSPLFSLCPDDFTSLANIYTHIFDFT